MINKRCDRKGEGERVCEKSERERKEGERKEGERWRAGGKEEEREGGKESVGTFLTYHQVAEDSWH